MSHSADHRKKQAGYEIVLTRDCARPYWAFFVKDREHRVVYRSEQIYGTMPLACAAARAVFRQARLHAESSAVAKLGKTRSTMYSRPRHGRSIQRPPAAPKPLPEPHNPALGSDVRRARARDRRLTGKH